MSGTGGGAVAPSARWTPARLARLGVLVALALVPAAAVLGGLAAGADGARGGALGGLVAVVLALLGLVSAVVGDRLSAAGFAVLLGGAMLVKLVLLAVGLSVLSSLDGVAERPLALAALAGLLVALAVEGVTFSRSRDPVFD